MTRLSCLLAATVLLCTLTAVQAGCPNLCNGHGDCSGGTTVCSCFDGWTGGDCSQRTCPFGSAWVDEATASDNAHNSAECSNAGSCDRATGVCNCMAGFEGASCSRMSCANDCHGHGFCMSMRRYALQLGFSYANWDADKVYGCVCDSGYEGYDCSLRSCPTGDDPLTTGQLNEVQVFTCQADAGTFTLSFRGETTTEIAWNADSDAFKAALEALPTISQVSLTPDNLVTTACASAGAVEWQIEFTQDFGDLPALTGDVTNLDLAAGDGTVTITTDGSTGPNGMASQTGTKEDSECAGRGRCDQLTGICTCNLLYATSDGNGAAGTRGDCGYATGAITACPGETECSGHGVCDGATFACSCAAGFTGSDCSLRTCPSGPAWFDAATATNEAHALAVCSNMGVCDRVTGECNCREGFEGSACERMSCPGTTDCSGAGQCLSIATLATVATVNGDPTSYTYGSDPNNHATWDSHSVYGCKCDDGFTSYDCSKRSCPTGDDPGSSGQVDEVQALLCDAAGGTFTITFRGETTAAISSGASAADVETALEALSTIDDVTVALPNSATVCSDGNTDDAMSITFLLDFGDLPDITIDETGLTGGTHGITIATDGAAVGSGAGEVTSVAGTKEEATCSNRGVCDLSTGVCSCFTQFGSSDGRGGSGGRADCGYLLPIVPITTSL